MRNPRTRAGGLAIGFLMGSFALLASEAHADWGDRFLRTHCDPSAGVFEMEPLMIWNEDYDALEPEMKRNQGKVQKGNEKYFGMPWLDQEIVEHCVVAGLDLKFAPARYDYSFEIFQNDERVAHINMGAVWRMAGFVYKVRYKQGIGWQELCGRDDEENPWLALEPRRERTDECIRMNPQD